MSREKGYLVTSYHGKGLLVVSHQLRLRSKTSAGLLSAPSEAEHAQEGEQDKGKDEGGSEDGGSVEPELEAQFAPGPTHHNSALWTILTIFITTATAIVVRVSPQHLFLSVPEANNAFALWVFFSSVFPLCCS